MAHARQAIRQAAVAAVTGLTTTGASVGEMRAHDWPESSLPALTVLVESEEVGEDVDNEMGDIDIRDIALVVAGVAKHQSNVMDTLDAIAEEVETALVNDSTLAGLTVDVRYTGAEFDMNDDGDKPVGLVRLNFMVQYRVSRLAP